MNTLSQPCHSNTHPSDEVQAAHLADTLIHWIKSRRSVGNVTIPAPTQSQIEQAISCAMTAPDHKKLKPWRFIITQGAARHQLGQSFLAAAEAKARRENKTLDDKTRQKTYQLPLRAPLIITVITNMQYHEKVPAYEQLLSTGAAVQNLILALQAQGFSSVWRTGLLANEPEVKRYFNVGADDYVAAFIYTGTSPCNMPIRGEMDTDGFIHFDEA